MLARRFLLAFFVATPLLAACQDAQDLMIPRCRAGDGVSAAPTSIAEVVTLVNSFPRPVTLECLLESLDRPLYATAVISTFSLQPAVGRRSPRIFLMSGPLAMSIVVAGQGRPLLEFGQMIDDQRSLKGELRFPISDEVTPAAPFDKVRDEDAEVGTNCRVCHGDESRFEEIDYADAFASIALRPVPRLRVDLGFLLEERLACDSTVEPERCALLGSLFDHGLVMPREFPDSLPTFGN